MKVFVYDLDKCNGCHNCQIACKDEHVDNDWSPYAKPQPDTGQFWCKVDEEVCGKVPHVRVSYLPQHCNHCANPKCEQACNSKAFVRRDDGLLLIDSEACTGCLACVEACPYEAIYANKELGIAQKCTGCAHLLDDGWKEPRCVDACCTGALRFGEEEDFSEEIKEAVVLKPDAMTDPKVYYKNKPKRFVAATIVDIDDDEVVEGATVSILDASGETLVKSVVTDEFGDVWIEGLDFEKYLMKIEKEGFLGQSIPVDLRKKDTAIPELQFFKQVIN